MLSKSKQTMKYLKLIAVNLLLLFLLLFVLEWAMEKISPEERHHSVLSRFIHLRETALPNTSFTERPHPIFQQYTENLEMKNYRVETDSFGFIRSSSNQPNAETNIVFLGGSTTECRYVDDSLRFPSLVGKMLRQAGHSVNTFNAGVERSHSGHSLNVLCNKILHRNFDVVVLMHGINDLVHLSYSGSYGKDEKSNTRRNLVTLARPDFDEPDLYFFRKHGLGVRMEKSFQVLFPRLHYDLLAAKVKIERRQSPLEFGWEKMKPVGQTQFEEFRNNLRSFIALCQANGIRPVLMTQFNRVTEEEFAANPIFSPYREKLEQSETTVAAFCDSYKKMNDVVREVAAEKEVLLIDLDAKIPRSAALMYDMVHLNGEGAKVVAEVIFDALLPTSAGSNRSAASANE